MNNQEFRKYAHQMVDWMANYLDKVEEYPVRPQLQPREVYNALPKQAPAQAEPYEAIFKDFIQEIMPGITHWQHPSYFAYFPANSSYPSLLAEMLTATLGAQCMIWETSPAATELEEKVMDWLKPIMGIPSNWQGVIQDTASTATLCAILTARERLSNFEINKQGFSDETYRVYASRETHSSIEKAIKIAGIGKENFSKIDTDEHYALIPEALETAIQQDLEKGYKPLCVVATIGSTSSTAIDPLRAIGEICQKYHIFLHVDAAYVGTATLLPEKRWILDGLALADTYVFNPHKWMFTNFDCTAYFVKDTALLKRTFEIMPEYLKTAQDQKVNNYRDWGIQLGRRFRALKLWFVIRSFGIEGLQAKIRKHIDLAHYLRSKLETHTEFELLAPTEFNLVCFRFKPSLSDNSLENLNQLNAKIVAQLNQSGQVYLTHTKLNEIYTIRVVTGQTEIDQNHVDKFWELLLEVCDKLKNDF